MMLRSAFVYSSVLFVLFALTGQASATNYTLWIHGRNPGYTKPGNYADFLYWGSSSTDAGVNKKAVNWDGRQTITTQNYRIRDALDCFCTGNNWCYIAAHDAGDIQIGYTLATYGTTARFKKNPTPNSSGVCGNSNGTTQVGWNIKWVRVGGGLGGGSELADFAIWYQYPGDAQLSTTVARTLYNHNNTSNIMFLMYVGGLGTYYQEYIHGRDDEVVGYHSSGAVSKIGDFGNPTDWLFDGTLNMGTAACSDGTPKWSYHQLNFRDDDVLYTHYTKGNWLGITAKVREEVTWWAK